MKKLHHFLNHGIACSVSISLLMFSLSGCSGNNNNETAEDITVQQEPVAQQQTQVPQEEIVEEEPMEQETTQLRAEEPQADEAVRTPTPQPQDSKTVIRATSLSYAELDADQNNILDKNEFYDGFYGIWDENADSKIDEQEFAAAVENFFDNYQYDEYGKFVDWDADNDNGITAREFRQAMAKIVENKEDQQAAERLLVIWDQDNDEKIEKVELDNITVRLDKDDN